MKELIIRMVSDWVLTHPDVLTWHFFSDSLSIIHDVIAVRWLPTSPRHEFALLHYAELAFDKRSVNRILRISLTVHTKPLLFLEVAGDAFQNF